MSLDVYLYVKSDEVKMCQCLECGNEHPHTRQDIQVFWQNITHNLNTMADKAGIYEYLWRPDEIGITRAGDLIDPLTRGVEALKQNPQYFSSFNSPNGWGKYENFVPWVEKYLEACKEYPDATIYISR